MVAAIVLNATVLLVKYKTRIFSTLVLFVALMAIAIQINRRQIDFNRKGHPLSSNEEVSQHLQKEYLGESLYLFMLKVDQSIPVAF